MKITVNTDIPTLIYIVQGTVYTIPLELCNWSANSNMTHTTREKDDQTNSKAKRTIKKKFAKMYTVPRHLKQANRIKQRVTIADYAPEPEIEIKKEPEWFST